MNWFKKQISKILFNDNDIDEEYYEEKEQQVLMETEKKEELNNQTKRSSFRFPLISDDELDSKRIIQTEDAAMTNRSFESPKKSYAFDILKSPSQASLNSKVYDVEVSGIRQLLEERQNNKRYSGVQKSRSIRQKDVPKIDSTTVKKSIDKNQEKQEQVPKQDTNLIKKRFTPTKVPSPVYGFSKPSPINELLLKRGEGEDPLADSSNSKLEQEKTLNFNKAEAITENNLNEVLGSSKEAASSVVITEEKNGEDFKIKDETIKKSFIVLEEEHYEQKPIILQSELYEKVEEFPILAEEVREVINSRSSEDEINPPKENNGGLKEVTLAIDNAQAIDQSIISVTQTEETALELQENHDDETVQMNFVKDESKSFQGKNETSTTEDETTLQSDEEVVKKSLDVQIIDQKETFEAPKEYIENKTDEFAQQEVVEAQQLASELTVEEEILTINEKANEQVLGQEEAILVSNTALDSPKGTEEKIEVSKNEQRSKGSTLPFNVLMLKSDKEKLASKLALATKTEAFQSLVMQTSSGNLFVKKEELEEQIERTVEKQKVNELEELCEPNREEYEAGPLEEKSEREVGHQEIKQQDEELVRIVEVSEGQQKEEIDSIVEEQEERLPVRTYVKPLVEYLSPPEEKTEDREWMESQAEVLVEALSHFQVTANVESIMQGPAVTQFEITVGHGTKVSKIRNLADDLKLALAAKDIRIQAPIPGKSTIGIEIPNRISRAVRLAEVTSSEPFQNSDSPLEAALGLDLTGKPITIDLRKMPHGLIAGATGSGKSVCINSILVSLLYKADPHELKLMLIDPKMVELAPFNHIPHLVSPVITDVKAATAALKWAVEEMERRYQLFAHVGVRDLPRYNKLCDSNKEYSKKLPYILIVIDELADLMMMSPADVEEAISRIAQKARACGIHLILATQRPSVDVITGLIKSNIPTRVAFAVSSQIDSRTILDAQGAERLLGRGDMLYLGNGMSAPIRIQGTFVTDDEIEEIINHVRQQGEPDYIFEQEELLRKVEMVEEQDELFEEVCRFVFEQGSASTSSIQRRYHIGYNRAARLIDMLEKNGFVSEQRGSKPREVFITEADISSMFD